MVKFIKKFWAGILAVIAFIFGAFIAKRKYYATSIEKEIEDNKEKEREVIDKIAVVEKEKEKTKEKIKEQKEKIKKLEDRISKGEDIPDVELEEAKAYLRKFLNDS